MCKPSFFNSFNCNNNWIFNAAENYLNLKGSVLVVESVDENNRIFRKVEVQRANESNLLYLAKIITYMIPIFLFIALSIKFYFRYHFYIVEPASGLRTQTNESVLRVTRPIITPLPTVSLKKLVGSVLKYEEEYIQFINLYKKNNQVLEAICTQLLETDIRYFLYCELGNIFVALIKVTNNVFDPLSKILAFASSHTSMKIVRAIADALQIITKERLLPVQQIANVAKVVFQLADTNKFHVTEKNRIFRILIQPLEADGNVLPREIKEKLAKAKWEKGASGENVLPIFESFRIFSYGLPGI